MAQDVYDSLRKLEDSIYELFSELRYKTVMNRINLPNRFIQMLQSIANGSVLSEHMNGMADEIHKALSAVKALRIDSWSTNEHAEILGKELIEKEKEIEKLSNRIIELEKSFSSMESAIEEKQESVISRSEKKDDKVSDLNMRLITDLITLRDNQEIRRSFLIGQGENQDSPGMRLLSSILKETAALMEKNGIEIIEDSGVFMSDRHMAVDTVKTKDPNMADHIANIVRPGYSFNGGLIRPEEVFVYVMEE